MNRLPLAPPHRAGEPPTSYVSRIAAAYGVLAKEFRSDFGIGRIELANGDPDTLARVAVLGDTTATHLAEHAYFRLSDHEFRHRGQIVRGEQLTKGRLDVCARCIAEDIADLDGPARATAFYMRSEWCIDVVDTCPTHLVALTTVHEGPAYAYVADLSNLLDPNVDRMIEMARAAEARQPTMLQDYVLDRLDGRDPGVAILDAMILPAAIKTCEMLGAAACFGAKARCHMLDAPSLRAARIRGFEIASRGQEGIVDLLKTMTDEYRRRRTTTARGHLVRKAFHVIHEYLDLRPGRPQWSEAAFGPLRAIVAEFIVANFPLKEGEAALGTTVLKRRLHSISSLAKKHRTSTIRLKKVLMAKGVITVDQAKLAPCNIVFDAELGERVARDSVVSLCFRTAREHLGIARNLFATLAQENLISATAAVPGARAQFTVAMLDDFVDRLTKGAASVMRKEPQHLTLQQAARIAHCTQVEICRLILGGKLKAAAVLGRKREMRFILLDRAAVEHAAHGLDAATLSPKQFGARFGLKKEVALRLIKFGCVKAEVRRRAGHTVFRIPQSEVKAFRETYVSLGELRRARRMHHTTIRKCLDKKGVKPAFDRKTVIATIYRRDEIRWKLP